jgi:hypothetical protein
LRALALAALCSSGGALHAQPFAITNARILPVSGAPIPRGVVLVRDGKIEQVGADVKVPAGYQVIDAAGGTVMPGLVSAHSGAGLPQTNEPAEQRPNRFRRGGRRRGQRPGPTPAAASENQAADKVAASLYARQKVFGELLAEGVTSLAVAPPGNGLPGLAAVVDPAADREEQLVVDDAAYVVLTPARDTKTKTLIKDALAAARKVVEARKRPKPAPEKEAPEGEGKEGAQPKPSEAKEGAEKPAEKPTGDKPGEEAPPKQDKPADGAAPAQGARGSRARPQEREAENDPNAQVLADLLEGKKRAFVNVDTAADLLHFLDSIGDASFPAAVAVRQVWRQNNDGSLDVVLPRLAAFTKSVLMSPELGALPYTEVLTNPALALHAAGIRVGFLVGDSRAAVSGLRGKLIELVRCGLPADVVLRGVTLTPAEMLGIEKRVGSIEPGKEADLLLWSGDPMDPASALVRVWHRGTPVAAEVQ